jgi:hypothetical protein
MKSFVIAGVFGIAALAAVPAAAEHNGPARGEPGVQLDADFGERAFHLGARLLTPERTWGAWLWGENGPGGPKLDGRLEGEGKPLDFTVDAARVRAFLERFERWLPRP